MYKNEMDLTPQQIHFLRVLLDGKREIGEEEALVRQRRLGLEDIVFPCLTACVSPYYTRVEPEKKDELIRDCSAFVCHYLQKEARSYYCLTDSYDNIQILLPTAFNGLSAQRVDELFAGLYKSVHRRFALELFIGVGSEATRFSEISRSAMEAMEMLAFKYQYADRGVINIRNTEKFRRYSVYGEDIMFARVIGRFQDGDLKMMEVRLEELIESIRHRPNISKTAIKRTFVELAINILHIAANADVDVEAVLGDRDPYSWIMAQNHTEVLTEWLLDLSAGLLEQTEARKKTDEKEIIRRACEFIAGNIGDADLSLQTVSDAAGLSSSYFSQLFKAEKGIGLSNYITESRILRARSMLESTELKNEEIARQLGFASATYFGRVFKKYTGLTPNAFRKQTRKPAEEQRS